jgi:CHAT domain-containing protein/Tfp pilus assembly protein PilF
VCFERLFTCALAVILLLGLDCDSVWSQQIDPQERFRDALRLMEAGQYERAVEELQNIISDHPDFSRAYRSLERAYIFLDDLPGMRTYLAGRLEETPDNPYAHHALGRVAEKTDDCIAHLKKSIVLDETFAPAYRDLAHFYWKKGTREEAIVFFRDLLARNPDNGNAYFGLGHLYYNQGKWDQALEMLEKAVEMDPESTLAHTYMIPVYGRTGRYAQVIETSSQLLEAAKRRNEFENVAYAHLALGNSYQYLGDYWQALHHYNQSVNLAKEVGERGREGAALNGIGNVYTTLGEHEKALEFHRAAYEFSKSAKDDSGQAVALNNIALCHIRAGNPEKSLSYIEEALEIARKKNYRNEESNLLLNKAAADERMGDRDKAVEEYRSALQLAKELDDKANEGAILRDLGQIEIKRGRYTEATDYFKQARAVADETGDMEHRWSAEAGLGKVFEHLGEKERAISHYAEAIGFYNQARKLGIESMGTGFLEHHENVYPPVIELLAEAGRNDEAFSYAQQYKAASLLQVMSEGRSVIDELLPEKFRSPLNELRDEIQATHHAMAAARTRPEEDDGSIQALERQLTDLEIRKASLLEEIRQDDSSYYHLASAEPAGLETIRSQGLTPEQTLVEYIVGEDKLSLFILTQDQLHYREAPVGRESLERMLADLSPVFEKRKKLDEETRKNVFSPELADFSIPPAQALYDVLLKPVEPLLAEGTELVIVPDGLLFYLPFETLIADAAAAEHRYDFGKATFLVERHAVSYVASASLLDPALQRPREAERGLLAFGNPDFSRGEDDRLPREFFDSNLSYSGGIVRGGELLPLPAAEAEVGAIKGALGRTGSRVYVGQQATEDVFKKEAAQYRILHLATHFLSDDRQPLYSKIVLAQDPEAEEDGFLQTYEIFNTRLNADLVVLSACNTGLGKLSKGEGLAGISRAFLYAGVPSLLVSLWSVDDESTSTLMQRFYERLAEGLNKKQALRQAKLDYLRTAANEKRDPFYWAPFILIGDWQPLDLPEGTFPFRWPIAVCFVLAIMAAAAWVLWRRADRGASVGA